MPPRPHTDALRGSLDLRILLTTTGRLAVELERWRRIAAGRHAVLDVP